MENKAEIFDQIVKARRAVRKYREDAKLDEQAVVRSLERAVLSPNSSNLQTWEFIRVHSHDIKKEAARLCMNQGAARTAQELVIVVCRGDKWRENSKRILNHIQKDFSDPPTKRDKRAIEYYKRNIPLLYRNDFFGFMTLLRTIIVAVKSFQGPMVRWNDRSASRIITHKSAALAAQTFMLSIQAEGYATCPMEGFDEKRMKRLLNIPRGAEINMVIAVGVAEEGGVYSSRFRFPNDEIIRKV